jgi:hypothetical protein
MADKLDLVSDNLPQRSGQLEFQGDRALLMPIRSPTYPHPRPAVEADGSKPNPLRHLPAAFSGRFHAPCGVGNQHVGLGIGKADPRYVPRPMGSRG